MSATSSSSLSLSSNHEYSQIQSFENQVKFIQLPSGVEIAVKAKDSGSSLSDMQKVDKSRLVAIPKNLKFTQEAHARAVLRRHAIVSVDRSRVWIDCDIQDIDNSEELVHWLNCLPHDVAIINRIGENVNKVRSLSRKALIAIGMTAIEIFSNGKKTEKCIEEVAFLAGSQDLLYYVLKALDPDHFEGVMSAETRRNLLQGQAQAIRHANEIDANDLDTLLTKTSNKLSSSLRATAAPEAREELLALFDLYTAVIDKMVNQGISLREEKFYDSLCDQIQEMRKSYGLGNKRVHKIKRLMTSVSINLDAEILFLATYAQQGLCHLRPERTKDLGAKAKEYGHGIFEAVTILGGIVASPFTGGLSHGITSDYYVGFQGINPIKRLLSKRKGKHTWYTSLMSFQFLLKEYSNTGKSEYFDLVLDNLRNLLSKTKKRNFSKKEVMNSVLESYSYLLYGVIGEVEKVIFLTKDREVQRNGINFLVEVYQSRLKSAKEAVKENANWWGNNPRVITRSFLALQQVYVNQKIRVCKELVKGCLGEGDEVLQVWSKLTKGGNLDEKWVVIGKLNEAIKQWQNKDESIPLSRRISKFLSANKPLGKKECNQNDKQSDENVSADDVDREDIDHEHSFRLHQLSNWLYHIIIDEKGNHEIQKESLQLLCDLYKNLQENLWIKIKFQTTLMRIWWKDSKNQYKDLLRTSLGNVACQWMEDVKNAVFEGSREEYDAYGSLDRIIEASPWCEHDDPLIQNLFWYPMRWIVECDSVTNSQLDRLYELRPEGSMDVVASRLERKRADIKQQNDNYKEIGAVVNKAKDKISDVNLIRQAQFKRFPFNIRAEEQWKEVSKEIYFIEPKLVEGDDQGDLMKRVKAFLDAPEQKALLLLGEPGAGKSIVARYIAQQLASKRGGSFIPIFIPLAFVQDPKYNCLSEAFEDVADKKQVQEWMETQSFLFILDGYDELGETYLIYRTNQLMRWKKSKVIYTCRSQLSGQVQDIDHFFTPESLLGNRIPNSLVKLTLPPFTIGTVEAPAQREEFLNKYIDDNMKDAAKLTLGEYLRKIEDFNMIELSGNPFLLRALAEVLPTFDKSEKIITRTGVYKRFIKTRFDRDSVRATDIENLPISCDDLLHFSESMALLMLAQNSPVLDLAKQKSPQQGRLALDQPAIEEMKSFQRYGSMITSTGKNLYSFMHKSLYEYFGARALIEALMDLKGRESFLVSMKSSPFNVAYLGRDIGIIHFIVEMIREYSLDRQEEVINFLWKTIELVVNHSDADQRQELAPAVSNMLTLLNALDLSFSGRDLSGIIAPNADLTAALFQGAKLDDIHIEGSQCQYAFIDNKELTIECETELLRPLFTGSDAPVTKVLFSNEGKFLYCCATGKKQGFSKWNLEKPGEPILSNQEAQIYTKNMWVSPNESHIIVEDKSSNKGHEWRYIFGPHKGQSIVHQGGKFHHIRNDGTFCCLIQSKNKAFFFYPFAKSTEDVRSKEEVVTLQSKSEKLLNYAPENQTLATWDDNMRIIRIYRDRQFLKEIPVATASTPQCVFSNQGGYCAAVVKPHSYEHLLVWDLDDSSDDPITFKWVQIVPCQHLSFSPDDAFLALGNQAGKVEVLDLKRRQTVYAGQFSAQITSLAFSPDKTLLAIGCSGEQAGVIKFWRLLPMRHTKTFGSIQHPIVDAQFIQHDGRLTLLLSDNRELFKWDVATRALIEKKEITEENAIKSDDNDQNIILGTVYSEDKLYQVTIRADYSVILEKKHGDQYLLEWRFTPFPIHEPVLDQLNSGKKR